jgi:non-ribosomal peptide synthase protein (TIGR01720 family)
LFESGNGQPARLLVVAHHLVVDVISWGVLLEDLAAACRARAAGATPPARTAAPFADWARSLEAWARTPAVAEQAPFWERQTRTVSAVVPRDVADGVNDEGSRAVVDRVLGADVTARLFDRQRKGQARAVDVLVTALVTSCLEWSGGDTLRVDLEGHGREDIGGDADVSRTIGWFTAIHPVALSVDGVRERHPRLDAIRRQLEAVPHGGLGYGALRYLAGPAMAERLTPATPAEVSFLYVGRQSTPAPEGALFRAVPPPASAGRDPQGRRHYVLDVTAYVLEGQMHIQLAYSRNLHRPATIDRLADRMIEMAADLADGALPAAQPAAPAASHFPGARLNQQQMDTLISKLRRPRRTDR